MKTSLLNTLLRPGMNLMLRLGLRHKLHLVSALLTLPMVVLLLLQVRDRYTDMVQAHTELHGGAVVWQALDVVQLTLTHRGQSYLLGQGDHHMQMPLDQTRRRLDESMQVLEQQVQAWPELGLGELWRDIAVPLRRVTTGAVSADVEASFQAHTALVHQLEHFIHRTAEHSELTVDAQSAAHVLADLAVERATPWLETLGHLRGLTAALVGRGQVSSEAMAVLQGRAELLAVTLRRVELQGQALQRAGEPVPDTLAAAVRGSRDFVARVQERLADRQAGADPVGARTLFDEGTATLQGVARFEQAVLQRLDELLAQRAALAQHRLLQIGVAAWLALLMVAYLLTALTRSVSCAAGEIRHSVSACAAGNLAGTVQISGRDEFAQIGRDLEQMTESLSVSVAEIRSQAGMVGMAGQTLATASREMAQHAHEQVGSLQESSAAVHQLSNSVQHNADQAINADRLTTDLSARAEAVSHVMQEALQSMGRIEQSSQRMGEIIAVIDEIAFQTSILALNASVEAARAGETGRGFAVVAGEVRQLAHKSSQSAAEIRQLIFESDEEISGGARSIRHVGQTLDEVVGGIRTVAGNINRIAGSSEEQSGGLRQVAASIAELESITQRNSAMVAQAAHEAEALLQRASSLAGAVANIRLRQGTADEAFELVAQARQLYEREGLESLLGECNHLGSRFADRDLYVFVLDRVGTYLAYAGQPIKVGFNLSHMKGLTGAPLIDDLWQRAEQGSGWVDYSVPHPITGVSMSKASYVVALSDEHLVGCGVYKHQQKVRRSSAATADQELQGRPA